VKSAIVLVAVICVDVHNLCPVLLRIPNIPEILAEEVSEAMGILSVAVVAADIDITEGINGYLQG
jgi:hypothetical protein